MWLLSSRSMLMNFSCSTMHSAESCRRPLRSSFLQLSFGSRRSTWCVHRMSSWVFVGERDRCVRRPGSLSRFHRADHWWLGRYFRKYFYFNFSTDRVENAIQSGRLLRTEGSSSIVNLYFLKNYFYGRKLKCFWTLYFFAFSPVFKQVQM